jgi:methionine-rich copper-binding protein CopC
MKLRTLISMASLAGAVILTSAFAMHLRLVKSVPSSGEVVTSKPTELRLWFSQKPDVGLTTVKLVREDSTTIELGKVVRTDDSLAVRAPLDKTLVPGTYVVSWRSVSRDGHAVRGSYRFTMAATPPAHNY